ncbi:hypothetical protein [Alteromonas sp. CYL-A6]|uniref:hypothetical protein n=1 Tax=Alteromonas nitratireducens TaxID=3390813 RepID=UPI0034B4B4A5
MKSNYFEQFRDSIINYVKGTPFTKELHIDSSNETDVYFSPFDSVNKDAKICIIGISPGSTQADIANCCARDALNKGESLTTASEKAKVTASFSGALRSNLVALLDHVGLTQHWGLNSAEQLFSSETHLLHSTSVFRYPTLLNGKPITSAKNALKQPLLKKMVDSYLLSECCELGRDTLYIPLGNGVEEVLNYLVTRGVIESNQILSHLPHPSGANAERIAYFLGKKERDALSMKTNPVSIDSSKAKLFTQLSNLGVTTPTERGTQKEGSIYSSKQDLPIVRHSQMKSRTNTSKNGVKHTFRSVLVSPNDGFMLESVERQIKEELAKIGLSVRPNKSRTSKELAILKGEKVIAYISRKSGLKNGTLTLSVHPKAARNLDRQIGGIDGVSIHQRRGSRYISSSNYSGFNSKGYCPQFKTNEHQAAAYKIDVSRGFSGLRLLLNEY